MVQIFDKISSVLKENILTPLDERRLKEMCYIGDLTTLKENNTHFILPIGVVISKFATIGKNCVIYQNVTIGGRDFIQNGDPKNYPHIGDNCIIYPGAFIVGPITIGENSIIGANSVVVSNVPPNSILGGNPAKIISTKPTP